jgi:hypothetical protein
MWVMAKFVWPAGLATPKLYDSIMFRAVRGAILEIVNKNNPADLFKNADELKFP